VTPATRCPPAASTTAGDAIVHLDQVRFRWRPRGPDILDIPHFAVRPGERVLIKGISGSGKTTLLNLLNGVITPQQGAVTIQGTPLNTLNGPRRDAFRAEHVGFIFQLFNLIPYLPLVENVCLPCRFSAARRRKALKRSATLAQEAERLRRHLELDIATLARRPVTELSVGQQQRVAAARALIGGPALVIADEPTSALDADTRQSFLALLFKEAEATGATVLMVSHDASLDTAFDRSIALATLNRAGSVGQV
jgi:putative ABC transport system ATP-binding protein